MAVGRVLVDSRARKKPGSVLTRSIWGILLTVAVLAVAGIVFTSKDGGGDPATMLPAASDSPMRIEAAPVAHFREPTTIHVRIRGGASTDGVARVWVPAEYLQKVEVKDVSPVPDFVEAAPDGMVYVFRLQDPSRPADLAFTFIPSEVGPLSGRIGLLQGGEATFDQFVYP